MNGVTPEQFGIFLLIVLTLLPAVNTVKGWFQPTQKREVSFADKFATTQQLKEVEHDLSGRIGAVDRDVKALKESIVVNGEKRRIAIENKVEAARSEARASHDATNRNIAEMNGKIGKIEATSESTNTSIMLLSEKVDRLITAERRIGL